MGGHSVVDQKIRELVREDPRYSAGAYEFVFDALDYAMMRYGKHRRRGGDRHLSVEELLDGIRSFAIGQFGPLARVVLESAGLYGTEDLGEVVFNLVGKGLLNKQESDDREQFANGFSFREAFDEGALAEILAFEL
ncbi:MAG: hypothetical protein HY812_10605 [Planctomycetes bacterium]|nr:hypothetical protein [Planctomycetota bacterium]